MGIVSFPSLAQVPTQGKPSTRDGASAQDKSTALLAAFTAMQAAHPGVDSLTEGDQLARVFGPAFSNGDSPAASADAFLSAHANVFGVQASELAPIGPFEDGAHLLQLMPDREMGTMKFTGVYYTQTIQGVPVFRSHLCVLVRNEAGFPAVLASSTLWNSQGMSALVAGRNLSSLPPVSTYTRRAFDMFDADVRLDPAQYVIWAGVDRVAAEPRLAVKFEAEGGNIMMPATFQRILFVVDADTGEILYQENRVYGAVDGQLKVNSTAGFSADVCTAETIVGMPYGEIKQGANTYYADADGFFNIPGAGTLTYTTRTAGKFFTVNDNGAAPMSISAALADGSNWQPVLNSANATEEDRAEVNAYLQANIVRDMVLESSPSYPSVSSQGANFPIAVNLNDTCNAFYTNSSINFFHSGGGCNNTAFGTVVHHEYGHNVVDKGGSGQGAYGEGMGDVMGVLVSNNPLLGIGFSSCSSHMRNANNACQYQSSGCSSCGSAIHSCGQLISGCVWSLRTEMQVPYPADYLQRTADLAVNSIPLHGAVSTIAADIVIDYLTLDDDNADITDGTPNYNRIASAFGAHNLPAPGLAAIKFTFPSGLPATVLPGGGTQIPVNVEPLSGFPQAGSGKAFIKMPGSGSFVEFPLTATGANSYILNFPAGTCGGEASFYFSAMTTGGATLFHPSNFPTTSHSTILATSVSPLVTDGFEVGSGWVGTVAGDTATSGLWGRLDPVGTAAQPEDDHSPAGTICWVTGNAGAGESIGANDVDGGYTTLLSPAYNFAGEDGVFVSYWRWYSNDQGASPNADVMPIEVSNNNGASWVTMESVSQNAGAWVFKRFRVNNFVTLTSQVRFRFRAQDLGAGSLVEAAIDDFQVISAECAVLGDLNGDGIVDGADLGALLGLWGQPGIGDLNGDGTTDGADLGILLGEWG